MFTDSDEIDITQEHKSICQIEKTRKMFTMNIQENIPEVWKRGSLYLLYNQFPNITYEPHFCGTTNYLDRIRASDLSAPIMQGIDHYGRSFICIRYKCLDDSYILDDTIYTVDTNKVCCLTIFQRYTDCSTWCKAGADSMSEDAPLLYGTSTCLTDETITLLVDNVFRMLSEQPILYYDYSTESTQTTKGKKYLKCKLVESYAV